MSAIWAGWLIAVAVSFAFLEGYALWTKRTGDTLSENTRRWLGIQPVRPWRRWGVGLFSAVLMGFVAWFLPHITIGLW